MTPHDTIREAIFCMLVGVTGRNWCREGGLNKEYKVLLLLILFLFAP